MTPLHLRKRMADTRAALAVPFRRLSPIQQVTPLFLFAATLMAGLLSADRGAHGNEPLPLNPMSDRGTAAVEPEPDRRFRTGTALKKTLDRQMSLAWQGQTLRAGLEQLSEAREIAILLDRRIDPGQKCSLQVRDVSLQALLGVIASEVGAEISIFDNVVYIGPVATALRLRTVMERATDALVSPRSDPAGNAKPSANAPDAGRGASIREAGEAPQREATKGKATSAKGTSAKGISATTRRSFELMARRTLTWSDLTTPQQILLDIGQQYSLEVEPIDRVPHDLWAGATIPSASAPQMLLLVLAQFDLSFEWSEDRTSIRIVPMPVSPKLTRQFRLRRGQADVISTKFNSLLPDIEHEFAGRRLIVHGSVEQIEQVERLLYPDRFRVRRAQTKRARTKRGPKVVTYSFSVARAPLTAFMRTLEQQSGFRFAYDPEAFSAAGIRLDQPIELGARELTAEELLEAMFEPHGIRFERDGQTVRLSPARAEPIPE